MDIQCGGCRGLGSHRRWCTTVNGAYASLIGHTSETLGSTADLIGANNPELANKAYALSAELRDYAREAALRHQARRQT